MVYKKEKEVEKVVKNEVVEKPVELKKTVLISETGEAKEVQTIKE